MSNNTDQELFELCKGVYELFPEWKNTDLSYCNRWSNKAQDYIPQIVNDELYIEKELIAPLYTSDYLLEKLPEEIGKKKLIVTNGDRPYVGYAQRDDYGNYVLDDRFYKDAQYSDEVRKALLKLTLALHEAGELK